MAKRQRLHGSRLLLQIALEHALELAQDHRADKEADIYQIMIHLMELTGKIDTSPENWNQATREASRLLQVIIPGYTPRT